MFGLFRGRPKKTFAVKYFAGCHIADGQHTFYEDDALTFFVSAVDRYEAMQMWTEIWFRSHDSGYVMSVEEIPVIDHIDLEVARTRP